MKRKKTFVDITHSFNNAIMKPINILLIFLVVCFFTPSVYGQHKRRVKRSNSMRFNFTEASVDSIENALKSDGFIYGGANLMNHVTTLGRDNNINQWAVSPILGIHKYNCDIYANGFRWSQTVPKWAETDLGINKLWKISEPFNLLTTYEHAFVNYGTDDDRYGLNNLVSVMGVWTHDVFELDARYEYDWGRNAASILEFSIAHEWDLFKVLGADKIEITPHFYLTYLGGITYPVRFFRSNTLNPEAFQRANYEIELPFTWRKIGNIEAELSFIYDIPKNVLPEEGSGRPIFYVTGSVIKVFDLKNRRKKR